jgi:acetyl-CoA C-acetyltransferase
VGNQPASTTTEVPATTRGAIVVEEAIRRAAIDADQVEEILMGNVLQAGFGQNPARQGALGPICRRPSQP